MRCSESWFRRWLRDLAFDLIVAPLLASISKHDKEIKDIMASQEERLRAISVKIDEVKTLLATLKENNPEIEDEISEIESKLDLAPTEPPAEPPA